MKNVEEMKNNEKIKVILAGGENCMEKIKGMKYIQIEEGNHAGEMTDRSTPTMVKEIESNKKIETKDVHVEVIEVKLMKRRARRTTTTSRRKRRWIPQQKLRMYPERVQLEKVENPNAPALRNIRAGEEATRYTRRW